MRHLRLFIALTLTALVVVLTMPALANSHTLEADLERLLTWFPGNYDNHQQVYKQAQDKVVEAQRHRHTNHTFQPLSINGIGGHTLYAQQYQHYDPNDIYRQRIYSFQVDQEEQAIRLTIYTPKDPTQLTDAHLDPTKVANLSADDFILKPGCEVFWKYQDGQFNGYLKHNACNYYSERFQTQVYLNETLTLRKDALLLHDTAVDANGKAVFGSADKGPTINLKQD